MALHNWIDPRADMAEPWLPLPAWRFVDFSMVRARGRSARALLADRGAEVSQV